MPLAGLQHLQDKQYWKKHDKILGRGKFGDVYLYTNLNTGFNVAVKEVKFDPNDAHVDTDKKALENEIKIYETLSHERITTYFGHKEDNENCIILLCLEYSSGGSLFAHLQKNGRFNTNTTVEYTCQVLEGLAYLHHNKIAHRDINGKNILISNENKIKLADFGISKQLETLSSTRGANTSGVGTVKWTAPEVVSKKEHGLKVDIWSVGCTMVEMLTTHPPWNNMSDTDVYKAIEDKKYPTYALPPSGDKLEPFLFKCFQAEPAKRPSAQKLLTTIR